MKNSSVVRLLLAAGAAVLSGTSGAGAQVTLPDDASEVVLSRGFAIDGVGRSSRRPINTDAVIAAIVNNSLDAENIKVGDGLALPPGSEETTRTWREIVADEKGAFSDTKPGTYILVKVTAAAAKSMYLSGSGYAMAYVNGEPRMGDPYGTGYVSLPVQIERGVNTFLFAHAGRGALRATLRPSPLGGRLLTADFTLPDLAPNSTQDVLLGLVITNNGREDPSQIIELESSVAKFRKLVKTPFDSVTKLPFTIKVKSGAQGEESVQVRMFHRDTPVQTHELKLRIAEGGHYKQTFESRIDGSVQYYSVVPPAPLPADSPQAVAPALVLSLHGASVEATSQAGSYRARPNTYIVCPTNRRPYGFDWEDWGRLDAIEVMDLARTRYQTDPSRQYLTGHSMGGHGTWQLGVLYPERFAAIAPSAGWLSFDSYAGANAPAFAPKTPLGAVFEAARAPSMTLNFINNLKGKGIFILHGDADDNVPVTQARAGRAALDAAGITYGFHEQAGAGHWWGNEQSGAACLDWPAIWETFERSKLPSDANANVPVPLDARGFAKGSFKRAFDERFVLVYGTGGTRDEELWSLAKARFDGEQWWYRGNGTAIVLSDLQFISNPTPGNVILYGNKDTNRAWLVLVDKSSPTVESNQVTIGTRKLEGPDLTCLFAVPRKGMPERTVGIIGGTGIKGMRATDRLNYFLSGTGYPELMIMRSNVWSAGFDAVEAASVGGEIIWK